MNINIPEGQVELWKVLERIRGHRLRLLVVNMDAVTTDSKSPRCMVYESRKQDKSTKRRNL